jgi:hypothetical protein
VTSTETIPAGRHVISAEIKVDKEGKFGTGGSVTLRIGKKKIAKYTLWSLILGQHTHCV